MDLMMGLIINDSDDVELKALFVKRFKKYMKNNKMNPKKEFPKNKSFNKPKCVTKNDKNTSKIATKPIQCFKCQGFGHPDSKSANQLK